MIRSFATALSDARLRSNEATRLRSPRVSRQAGASPKIVS
ncbi:hypothetical protein RB213_014495 [Colletotrichum asianum]